MDNSMSMRSDLEARIGLVPAKIADHSNTSLIDILILGGGLSGLSVAFSAARANPRKRILVLEAGPVGPRRHIETIGATRLGFARWTGREADPFLVTPPHLSGGWCGAEGRVLGGRGLNWHGVLCRINPPEFEDDLSSKRWLEDQGLGTAGKSYTQVENTLRELGCFRIGGDPLPSTACNMPFRTTDRAFNSASGAPFAPTDYFAFHQGQASGVEIMANTAATLLTKQNRTWKVQCTHGVGVAEFCARRVVLACGLIGNCRLLETYMRTQCDYTFTDHLDAGVVCFIPCNSVAYAPLACTEGNRYIWESPGRRGFNVFLTFARRAGGLIVIAWGTGEKDTSSPIELSVAPDGMMHIQGRKSAADREKELAMIAAAKTAVEELLSSLGERTRVAFSSIADETKTVVGSMSFDPQRDWSTACYISALGSTDHEACLASTQFSLTGTGSFSDDPTLSIVGPAALKRMGSANPNFSAIALALRMGTDLGRQ